MRAYHVQNKALLAHVPGHLSGETVATEGMLHLVQPFSNLEGIDQSLGCQGQDILVLDIGMRPNLLSSLGYQRFMPSS